MSRVLIKSAWGSDDPTKAAFPVLHANAFAAVGHYVKRYDYALQTMPDVPYDKWREYDPEDTVRFYALRLYEARMIKSSPQKSIA